jgi:hypothetical protein
MGNQRFLNKLNAWNIMTKIGKNRVKISTLSEGDYFIFPNLYGGLIGILISCSINATVKWVNHPEKPKGKKEVISLGSEVFRYHENNNNNK